MNMTQDFNHIWNLGSAHTVHCW